MRAEMTEIVMPGDANPMGTAFGGRIMAWIDTVAAIAAQRAVGAVVTASVDSIEFEKPVRVGDIITLKAAVNKAWNTSLEVGVQVTFQSPKRCFGDQQYLMHGKYLTYHVLSEPVQACRAYLTFVAVDDEGKRREIDKTPLFDVFEQPWMRRAEEAECRRTTRLANRKGKGGAKL